MAINNDNVILYFSSQMETNAKQTESEDCLSATFRYLSIRESAVENEYEEIAQPEVKIDVNCALWLRANMCSTMTNNITVVSFFR